MSSLSQMSCAKGKLALTCMTFMGHPPSAPGNINALSYNAASGSKFRHLWCSGVRCLNQGFTLLGLLCDRLSPFTVDLAIQTNPTDLPTFVRLTCVCRASMAIKLVRQGVGISVQNRRLANYRAQLIANQPWQIKHPMTCL